MRQRILPLSFRLPMLKLLRLGICMTCVFLGCFFCGVVILWESIHSLEDPSASKLFHLQYHHVVRRAGVASRVSAASTMRNGTHSVEVPRFDSTLPDQRLDLAVGPMHNLTLLDPTELKLPTPILVMGLMKAGTTSIFGYFQCGLDPQASTGRLSHYDCKHPSGRNHEKIGMACGKRIRRNLTKFHKAAFDTIDNFTLYAELDAQENNGGMTLPQWDYLEPIYQQFPNATWILNWREPTRWLDSVNRWKDLRKRFVQNAYLPDLPSGVGDDDQDMIHFYEQQAQRIRDFTRDHPSLSLVEVAIDSSDAGIIMERAFGISKSCWRTRNVNNGTAIWSIN